MTASGRFPLEAFLTVLVCMASAAAADEDLPFGPTNPIIWDNDSNQDVFTLEYVMALAHNGTVRLAAITESPHPYQSAPGNVQSVVDLARRSSLKNIPDASMLTATTFKRALSRPGDGQIFSTVPIDTPASRRIRDVVLSQGTASKPVVVATGGALTTVASAYLLARRQGREADFAKRAIVCGYLGVLGPSGREYNVMQDTWAAYICLTQLRNVWVPEVNGNRPYVRDVIPALPDNPLTAHMRQKQAAMKNPSWGDYDLDGPPPIAVVHPRLGDYVRSTVRISFSHWGPAFSPDDRINDGAYRRHLEIKPNAASDDLFVDGWNQSVATQAWKAAVTKAFSAPSPPPAGRDAFARIEAESHDAMQGILVRDNPAASGGESIGSLDNGNWVRFAGVDFKAGAATFQARIGVPSSHAGQKIEVRLDSLTGPVAGALTVAATGDWTAYTTQSTSVSGASGVRDLYLVFRGSYGVGNLDWIGFAAASGGGEAFTASLESVSTGRPYSLSTARPGALYFIDRSYTVASMSSGLDGGILIRTANNDKNVVSASHLRLSVSGSAVVYVACDKRATRAPSWLSGWTLSSESLAVSDAPASPLRVYRRAFPAGPITLGGNQTGGPTGAASHYVVVIRPSSSAASASAVGDFSAPEAWENPGDADGDGLMDAFEASAGTDPARVDTDGDGAPDEAELDGLGQSLWEAQSHDAAGPAEDGSGGRSCGLLGVEAILFLAALGRRRRARA